MAESTHNAADTGLLGLLDPEALAALRRVSRSISYMPGAAILRQGEPADGAYFLESGDAEAHVALPGGGEFTVAHLGPGSVLGEMALLEQGVCSATVVAGKGVNMMVIERDDFRALVAQRDRAVLKIQQAVTWVLCRKLRGLNAKVMQCEAPEDRPVNDGVHAANRQAVVDGQTERDKSSSLAEPFDWRAFLPILPLFRGFTPDDIDEVVSRAVLQHVTRGEPLFAAGDAVDASWIVVRGAVEVSARYASERGLMRRRLAILGPGEWLGAMSLLDGATHGSDAVCREEALLLRLSREAFDALYYAHSPAAMKVQQAIQRTLLQSMRHTNNQLARLISQARIRERRAGGGAARELESALYGQICLLGS